MYGNKENKELEKLYGVITESSDLSRYELPPPRAKFQAGDIVITRSLDTFPTNIGETKFYSYHPVKKYRNYYNKPGVIIGYYNYPGAYTKYSVKLEDGNILPFHSNYLFGPFKSLQIAKTYQDEKKTIVAADIKLPNDRPALETWQIKPNYEKIAQDVLTQEPYNFTWHTPPVELEKTNTTLPYVTFELGRGIEDCLALRTNNAFNKKLATKGYEIILPYDYCSHVFGSFSSTPFCFFENEEKLEESKGWHKTYIDSVQDLKKLLDPAVKLKYKTNFKFHQATEITEDLFLEVLQPYLERKENGYNLTVPGVKGYGKAPLTYIPQVLKNCPSFSNMTVIGDVDVYGYASYGALERPIDLVIAPYRVIGNLTFHGKLEHFNNIPKVTGEIIFTGSDKQNYITHLAGKHYENYKDLLR